MSKGRMATGSDAAVAELGERPAAGGAPGTPALTAVPDPEVPAKATRRRFTAEYKLRVLREAERQSEPGAIGALLRREGLYSTHLSAWRRQRERGVLETLGGRRRGRKPDPPASLRERIAELEAEKARLEERLRQAEAIITAQKNLSEILRPLQATAAQRESA